MQTSWPQLIVSSLILPAAVALLVSRYEARRQDTRERDEWFDNIVSGASGIESAWYRSSELTAEKQQSTIDTVDEYINRLRERKNSPLSSPRLGLGVALLEEVHRLAAGGFWEGAHRSRGTSCRSCGPFSQTRRGRPPAEVSVVIRPPQCGQYRLTRPTSLLWNSPDGADPRQDPCSTQNFRPSREG